MPCGVSAPSGDNLGLILANELTIGRNCIAQLVPCPFESSGHSEIESMDVRAKG